MQPGDRLQSGDWVLNMATDGNFTLVKSNEAKWALQTIGVYYYNPGRKFTLNGNGARLIDSSGSVAYTFTSPSEPISRMVLNSDGQVFIIGTSTKSVAITPPGQVQFFEHCDYWGQSKSFGIGDYPWIVDAGFPNDILSSIKIPAGISIAIYEHAYYEGRALGFKGPFDVRCLIDYNFNDIASSFKIYATPKPKRLW
jgi:hypothetical protein